MSESEEPTRVVCQKCDKEQDHTEFPRNRWGLTRTCRTCRAAQLQRDEASEESETSDSSGTPLAEFCRDLARAFSKLARRLDQRDTTT